MLPYGDDPIRNADAVTDMERAGLDVVWAAEAYSFDAVSLLGYLAARTERVEIGSAILPIYSRTPTLTAMSAAGLDALSGGRFNLGLGASGPQVIEGFHGVPYDKPVARTREIIDICRRTWRRWMLSWAMTHRGLTTTRWTGCWPCRRLANAGDCTGWRWPATRIPSVTNLTSTPTPGRGATG